MLSTQGDDIDEMVTAERIAILKVFGIAAIVMIALSLLLASTIAGPVRRLADSAERVRRRIKSRVEIPDFSQRSDEIGHLSQALRDMTGALYNRIDDIERFAADVAHELKNPLTSMRSAVEEITSMKAVSAAFERSAATCRASRIDITSCSSRRRRLWASASSSATVIAAMIVRRMSPTSPAVAASQ